LGRDICWTLKKTLPNLWIIILAFVLFKMHFSIIECNFKVTNLSILVMYDVQYDAATYGFKINWIFVFANHKGATRILNAWVLIFDGVHLRKFLNLICMFLHQDVVDLKNLGNVIFSFV